MEETSTYSWSKFCTVNHWPMASNYQLHHLSSGQDSNSSLRDGRRNLSNLNLFIYLGFYVAFNTVQVISRRVVGRAEETSTYSSSGFCTVNCRPTASNYQLSHLRPCREPNPGLRGGRRESYNSATVAPCQTLSFNGYCKENMASFILPVRDLGDNIINVFSNSILLF